MTTPIKRPSKGVVAVAILAFLAACGLPSTGPNKAQIFSGSVMEQGDAFVLTVDDRVNQIAGVTPSLGFSSSFQDAGLLGSDTIQPGDVLGLTVWENVDDGLLVPTGSNATSLDEVQVDGEGFIFVPYAGRILAAGNTPEAIRRIVSEKLTEQTPDPQVEVSRLAGDGATVSVVGSVGAQGVFPIERPTRTLGAMLAQAGGITIRPEIAKVTINRGGQIGTVWFQDIYSGPGYNIALRGGDQIVVEEDTRAFTALGATGTQNRIVFQSQTISAIEALAQVGGLNTLTADPTGVFVFRNEPERIAQQLVGDPSLMGTQRVIYVLDLTKPNGMFMARDFAIRDGDTVYVTEAPYTQFAKVLAAFSGSLVSVGNVAAVGQGF